MNTILVPLDFSRVSRDVVSAAVRLARLAKARLVLLHVVQLPVIATDYGLMFENIGVYTDAAAKDADRRLARLRTKLRTDGLRAEVVRMTGFPSLVILEQAKKRAASYIVIGSHGHTAFYDLLVGSTASGVLKRATCPVIVVPARKKAARKTRR
jgi:nucleotide-binding universal stress UspA family protein